MDDMDFDFGDSRPAAPSATSKTAGAITRFAPKQKGKPVKLSVPKPEPIDIKPTLAPIPTIKKRESEPSTDPHTNGNKDDDDPMRSNDGDDNEVDDVNDDDEREEEDEVVVQEINVFLTASPFADDASLYVMQYPLRPSWRPYELNERCAEVRVKPKQSKLEVDLSLDVDSKNYDQEVAALRLQKQTLSSSRSTSISYFAVGIRKGNQLHLNPVDAVVQLRPSITCLNVGGKEKKQTSPSIDANTKPSEMILLSGSSSKSSAGSKSSLKVESIT